jgi:hypothetical protein
MIPRCRHLMSRLSLSSKCSEGDVSSPSQFGWKFDELLLFPKVHVDDRWFMLRGSIKDHKDTIKYQQFPSQVDSAHTRRLGLLFPMHGIFSKSESSDEVGWAYRLGVGTAGGWLPLTSSHTVSPEVAMLLILQGCLSAVLSSNAKQQAPLSTYLESKGECERGGLRNIERLESHKQVIEDSGLVNDCILGDCFFVCTSLTTDSIPFTTSRPAILSSRPPCPVDLSFVSSLPWVRSLVDGRPLPFGMRFELPLFLRTIESLSARASSLSGKPRGPLSCGASIRSSLPAWASTVPLLAPLDHLC